MAGNININKTTTFYVGAFYEINGSRQHGLGVTAQPCAHSVNNSRCVLGGEHTVRNLCKHEATHHLPYIFCENNSI